MQRELSIFTTHDQGKFDELPLVPKDSELPLVPKHGEVALVLQEPLCLCLGRDDAPLGAVPPVVDGAEAGLTGVLATCRYMLP